MLGLDTSVRHARVFLLPRKERVLSNCAAERSVSDMARYRILRIYEVPADNRYQATDRMMEAIALRTERDYHVKDVIRECGRKTVSMRVELRGPSRWWTLLLEQLTGRAGWPNARG